MAAPATAPAPAPARLPAPWRVEDTGAAFKVVDANRVGLGWFYYGDGAAEAVSAGRLSRDQARRLAVNFARLPELLRQPETQKAPPDRSGGA